MMLFNNRLLPLLLVLVLVRLHHQRVVDLDQLQGVRQLSRLEHRLCPNRLLPLAQVFKRTVAMVWIFLFHQTLIQLAPLAQRKHQPVSALGKRRTQPLVYLVNPRDFSLAQRNRRPLSTLEAACRQLLLGLRRRLYPLLRRTPSHRILKSFKVRVSLLARLRNRDESVVKSNFIRFLTICVMSWYRI
jgi:hypothetical protein